MENIILKNLNLIQGKLTLLDEERVKTYLKGKELDYRIKFEVEKTSSRVVEKLIWKECDRGNGAFFYDDQNIFDDGYCEYPYYDFDYAMSKLIEQKGYLKKSFNIEINLKEGTVTYDKKIETSVDGTGELTVWSTADNGSDSNLFEYASLSAKE